MLKINKIDQLINLIDSEGSNPLQDIVIAEFLIARNPALLVQYPSLEDALKALNRVIQMQDE